MVGYDFMLVFDEVSWYAHSFIRTDDGLVSYCFCYGEYGYLSDEYWHFNPFEVYPEEYDVIVSIG